jgi:hypothetical protein
LGAGGNLSDGSFSTKPWELTQKNMETFDNQKFGCCHGFYYSKWRSFNHQKLRHYHILPLEIQDFMNIYDG